MKIQPASRFQEKFVLEEKLLAGKPYNNFPIIYEIRGALDADLVERSLRHVMAAHESMRACYRENQGNLYLGIDDDCQPVIEKLAFADRQRAETFMDDFIRKPFDLRMPPPHRLALIQLGEDHFIFLLVVHHILTDGITLEPLMPQWAAAYNALAAGKEPPAIATDSYADYLQSEREFLKSRDIQTDLRFWEEYLGDTPLTVDMPVFKGENSFGGVYFEIPGELRDKIRRFSRHRKSTFFWAVAAAWMTLLFRYSNQPTIAVNYPVNLRPPNFPNLFGPFINNLPLIAEFGGGTTFAGLLERITADRRRCKKHQQCMLADIVAHRRARKLPGGDSMMNVGIAETALRTTYPFELEGLDVRHLEPPGVGMATELLLEYEDRPDAVHCRLAYDGGRYSRWFAERMAHHFTGLLDALIDEPEQPVAAFSLLDEGEKIHLEQWNDTTVPLRDDRFLHRIFEAKAAARPDAPAVCDPAGELTRRELNERANRIAHALIDMGVRPDTPVGLALPRGTGLMTALLGIHKAGGAYLPIDPGHPPERIQGMIADADLRFLVTASDEAIPFSGKILFIDDPALSRQADGNPEVALDYAHLAYVLFTSGSTGRPKGVAIEHRSLINQIHWLQNRFPCGERDVVLQKTPLSFDASVWELFWWMVSGARLALLEPDGEKEPRKILGAMKRWGVTIIQFVPSLLQAVAQSVSAKDDSAFSRLRHLFCGGEPLTGKLIGEVRALPGFSASVHNLYGPTEATIDAAWHTCPDPAPMAIPIGRPVDNTRIHILDGRGSRQPVGIPGELCIAGVQVARGYIGNPELTAANFIPDPFSAGRLYKTGDLARWLPDGTIEFLGRIDQQVKIRGYRIETGEIESVLKQHPAVTEAVVHPYGKEREKRLGAWIAGAAEPCELRLHLAQRLPDYMMPSAFMKIDAFPLTASGKIDRKALPDPEPAPMTVYEAPRNAEEEQLCFLFAKVLDVERIGIHDDFFQRGGHSLLAIRLINTIAQTFAVEMPLKALFENPTPASLLEKIAASANTDFLPLKKSGLKEAPLSFAQTRFWFLDRFEGESGGYNIPAALRIGGDLDLGALEKSLGFLLARHDTLRTVFRESSSGAITQRVLDPVPFVLPLETAVESELREKLAEESSRPFDLTRGPLYRFRLFRIGTGDHVLSINIHHIVFDGWSFGILFEELASCYEAFRSGENPLLPEPPATYLDYAIWQRQWLDGVRLDRHSRYWKEKLAGIPALLSLPTDRPRPEILSSHGGHVPATLGVPLAEALSGLARSRGVTLFMALETLWAVFLAKYSGMEDIVVGTPVSGRVRPEIERITGLFVNTLPLRHDLSGNPTFADLLAKTRDTLLEADAHQDLPFEKLVEELAPTRSTGHTPVFQAMFVLGEESFDTVRLPGLETVPLFPEFDSAKFDLTLSLGLYGGRLDGHLEFSSDLFDRQTAERMVRHFARLAAEAVRRPDTPISELSLVDGAERRFVVEECNATAADYPRDKTLHRLFEEQAERVPGQIAVRCGADQLT
ncbi:MAG: amino acid adenylation domain-containing protein, partial [Desulfuromonadaceae bacterium]|nr:amino acid adenylation domain-containing protein [Desulfuromonadaceae bacterium]